MLLTSVARRGRPVGCAAESSFAQRGGAAQSGTTLHNSETQAPIFSGCLYSNLLHPGPKARMEGQQNQGMRAGRKEYFPQSNSHRGRARRPGDFLGTFVSLQKYLAWGRNIPVPPAGEILRKLKFTGRFLACKGICHVSRSRVPPGQGLARLADGHRGHGQQEHGEPLATAH